MPSIVTWLSTGCSLAALVLSVFALATARANRPLRLRSKMLELEAEIERLGEWYKKLNASYALIIARQKKAADRDDPPPRDEGGFEQLPGETPQAWKKRMRLAMAAGTLRHPNG